MAHIFCIAFEGDLTIYFGDNSAARSAHHVHSNHPRSHRKDFHNQPQQSAGRIPHQVRSPRGGCVREYGGDPILDKPGPHKLPGHVSPRQSARSRKAISGLFREHAEGSMMGRLAGFWLLDNCLGGMT